MNAKKAVTVVFMFRNQQCIIDDTRFILGDVEFHVSTIDGRRIGWFKDAQITEQYNWIEIGWRLHNGTIEPVQLREKDV